MNENEFRNAIIAVFEHHGYEKVFDIAQNSGGWEGWLQSELGALFTQRNIQYDREVRVWKNSSEECDFKFEDGFIAEIKCLGWKRIQKPYGSEQNSFSSIKSKWESFEQEVDNDWQKVQAYDGNGIAIAVVPAFTESDNGFRQGLFRDYHAININNTFHLYYKYK